MVDKKKVVPIPEQRRLYLLIGIGDLEGIDELEEDFMQLIKKLRKFKRKGFCIDETKESNVNISINFERE